MNSLTYKFSSLPRVHRAILIIFISFFILIDIKKENKKYTNMNNFIIEEKKKFYKK